MSKNGLIHKPNNNVTESKIKVAGNTVYSVGVVYNAKGETLYNLLLQQMKLRLSADKKLVNNS